LSEKLKGRENWQNLRVKRRVKNVQQTQRVLKINGISQENRIKMAGSGIGLFSTRSERCECHEKGKCVAAPVLDTKAHPGAN